MKLLSRNFSTKEKLLIALLAIILIGLVYYKLVYKNIQTALANANAEASTLQSELEMAQIKEAQINQMKNDMTTLSKSPKMGSYNNSKLETAFLHTVLSGISDYSISFSDVTRNGNQIRRNFTLQYRVPDYDTACDIMKQLTHGEYRCLINDVSCSVGDNGATSISLSGTFYETMVGGTPDSALPQDEAATAEAVSLEDFE